jgi:DNA-binding beta-propeller fold protein YncE
MRRAGRAALLLLACASSLLAAACGTPRGACDQAQALGSVCGFQNPEDVAFAPAANLVVSSQFRVFGSGGWLAGLVPGARTPRRLWPADASGAATGTSGAATETDAVPVASARASAPSSQRAAAAQALGDPACPPPDPAVFHPHGIFVDAGGILWVVNHGGRNSIEAFAIAGTGAAATLAWRGCMVLPDGASGNDLAVGPDGDMIVSNYASSTTSIVDNIKIGFGWNTGDVLRWRRDGGWSHVPNTAASAPNGVALSPDGRTLFYAETGGARLVRIGLDGSDRAEVPVPGGPDNLSWTERGTLYLASHTSSAAFLACVIGPACRSPWVLLEIDPQSLRVDEVLTHDGSVVGAVASAQQVGALVYLGAVFGDRVGVWRGPEGGTGALWSTLAGLPGGHVLADRAFAATPVRSSSRRPPRL